MKEENKVDIKETEKPRPSVYYKKVRMNENDTEEIAKKILNEVKKNGKNKNKQKRN